MKRHSVPGFSFAGVPAGIKKSGALDLALIFSERPAAAAASFTTNRIKAAPVKLCMKQISSGKGQAIIVNSGNANACSGRTGYRNAQDMSEMTAKALGISPSLVYVSSTGVIGRPLPIDKVRKSIPSLARSLSPFDMEKVASSIMTTDTFRKIISKKIRVMGKTGTIGGMAKGAGMICPNMATMLCFILTDIAVTPSALNAALRDAVKRSFNRISIDNDMSTNDTVIILANGLLGNKPISRNSSSYRAFADALYRVTQDLAKMIVLDGEGATKLIEITVAGARTEKEAETVARSVANSMLVKTAVYGRDPNWGRIIAAAGYSGVQVNEEKIDIYFNRVKLFSKGTGTGKESIAARLLERNNISIKIDLGSGKKSATALTCDMTEKYVQINAHYTT